MDPSGDGGGALTAAGLPCGSCGTELPPNSRFCNECGTPVTQTAQSAEYKQVTVLFADVVHSMDIAAAVGAERLREIMAELVNRAAVVVQRYGGTVAQFTGDGIMAVFGAPVALEDHAVRACLAALGVQEETKRLAVDVQDRDGVELQLRIGLNSGQVIAGEIGSGPFGYTTVGEQVGMAQRMESVAPPGGVMLSASTARLVDGAAAVGEPEMVRIKGAEQPVSAHRLLGMGERHHAVRRAESNLVGRRREMSAVESLLDRAVDGHGAVVGVVGPPGIGKSRLVREVTTMAGRGGVEVFTAFCESHESQVPFHAVARLLRAATGVDGLEGQAARDRVRSWVSHADPEDLVLFDDLLGIADPNTPLPSIDPDARRRRLTALVNAASLAREIPAVYVVEDAHWIDPVSESMLADFFTVIPQTPSLVIVTYRPEYRGALAQVPGAQTVALAPLSDTETAALVSQLLGSDSSVAPLSQTITERAAGTPFFAEEIVRELAERGLLRGEPGAYRSAAEIGEVSVPATLQASIAARIDRLPPEAKRTLSAAAVVGSRFKLNLLRFLGVEPVVAELVAAEIIDQVAFDPQPAYAFHHPMVRAVAYEAQLKSDRAEMHRRVAAAIQSRDPESGDKNAALIAEHWEAAGDLRAAFDWHMRAADWSNHRDIAAARTSWRRARQVADRLPESDPEKITMCIAPRTLLCATAFRVGGSATYTGFDELRDLCAIAGDKQSLAIGMTGPVMNYLLTARRHDASRLASELIGLLESIDDPTLMVALSFTALSAKHETAELAEVLRVAQRVIDLADGDPTKGNLIFESPLTLATVMRGVAGWCLGIAGWREDLGRAAVLARSSNAATISSAATIATVTWFTYTAAIPYGVLLPDATALKDTQQALALADQTGDDLALDLARATRGITLFYQEAPQREAGLALFAKTRERAFEKQFASVAVPVVDIHIAQEKARLGDLDGAIELSRTVLDELFDSRGWIWNALATSVVVEALLQRNEEGDVEHAQSALDRLESVPTDPGLVLNEITLLRLRALLARAHGNEAGYRDYRDRYRAMATSLGLEGHMAWAEAMP